MARHRDLSTTYDLAESDLDGFEIGLLGVLRHFCVSFAEPRSQCWTLGFGMATDRWGISAGPKAAQAVFYVLDAMQRTRVSMFQYNNPACPVCSARLTGSERHMMRMLHAVRRRQSSEARINAMLLVEGGESSAMLAAARNFACLFPVEGSAMRPEVAAGAVCLGRVNKRVAAQQVPGPVQPRTLVLAACLSATKKPLL